MYSDSGVESAPAIDFSRRRAVEWIILACAGTIQLIARESVKRTVKRHGKLRVVKRTPAS
jgi:hypothetical protein